MADTDRELLEMAAKAAGHALVWGEKYAIGGDTVDCSDMPYIKSIHPDELDAYWNPLTDDGDAFRLAVKCGISVLRFSACIGTGWPQNGLPARLIGFDPPYEDISSGQDVLAATRRAITRAAAEIGRSMT